MSMPEPFPPTAIAGELAGLRKSWLWLVLFGAVLIILGTVAISVALLATIATVFLFGVLFLIGAFAQVANAFWGRKWRGFFLHLLAGILYLIVGLIMIEHPLRAAAALTLMAAAVLLVSGLFRVILSLSERFHGWGW